VGLIERKIRRRSNQKLAEPSYTSTTMTVERVIAALRGICEGLGS
jgi:hypothetical protein